MKLSLYIDGGSRGNPGPAAAGVVLRDADSGRMLHQAGYFLGKTTNNVAEYQGLLHGLRLAAALQPELVQIHSDSELMVRQVTGQYRVKSADLQPLYQQALALLLRLDNWQIRHVPRAENAHADELANRAMDARKDVIVKALDAAGAGSADAAAGSGKPASAGPAASAKPPAKPPAKPAAKPPAKPPAKPAAISDVDEEDDDDLDDDDLEDEFDEDDLDDDQEDDDLDDPALLAAADSLFAAVSQLRASDRALPMADVPCPQWTAQLEGPPGPNCPAEPLAGQLFLFGPDTPAGMCVYAAQTVLEAGPLYWSDSASERHLRCRRCGIPICVRVQEKKA